MAKSNQMSYWVHPSVCRDFLFRTRQGVRNMHIRTGVACARDRIVRGNFENILQCRPEGRIVPAALCLDARAPAGEHRTRKHQQLAAYTVWAAVVAPSGGADGSAIRRSFSRHTAWSRGPFSCVRVFIARKTRIHSDSPSQIVYTVAGTFKNLLPN